MADSSIRLPTAGGGFIDLLTDATGAVHTLRLGGFVTEPTIQLSATSIAEDAADNSVVGTLSVANSPDGVTWTFSIEVGDDPDNKFAIANDDELQIDEPLDYETATSHLVTITATPSVGDVITRQFTITVTDVAEAEEDLPYFTILFA